MLLGENGAGKSTLMKILSGACRRDAGEIRVNGAAGRHPQPARRARARHPRHLPGAQPGAAAVGGREHLPRRGADAWAAASIDWRALTDRAAALLADLGMAIDPGVAAVRLGIAQRQMVEIAKALASGDATVLVMDEPTSSLTSREVDQLFALIERLAARGVAIVYITHRLDEVFRIGQRITVLRDGRHVITANADETVAATSSCG